MAHVCEGKERDQERIRELEAASGALREALAGLWNDGWISDEVHLDGCQVDDDDCGCPWPTEIRAALAPDAGLAFLAYLKALEGCVRGVVASIDKARGCNDGLSPATAERLRDACSAALSGSGGRS